MLEQDSDDARKTTLSSVDLAVKIIKSSAIFFASAAALLLVVAMTKDGADVGHQLLADLARGDIISIGIPR